MPSRFSGQCDTCVRLIYSAPFMWKSLVFFILYSSIINTVGIFVFGERVAATFIQQSWKMKTVSPRRNIFTKRARTDRLPSPKETNPPHVWNWYRRVCYNLAGPFHSETPHIHSRFFTFWVFSVRQNECREPWIFPVASAKNKVKSSSGEGALERCDFAMLWCTLIINIWSE